MYAESQITSMLGNSLSLAVTAYISIDNNRTTPTLLNYQQDVLQIYFA